MVFIIQLSKQRLAEGTHNLLLAQGPRSDLDETLDNNPSDKLVKSMQKLVKSVIETSNKMQKPKTNNNAVNNLINRIQQQKAINEEL